MEQQIKEIFQNIEKCFCLYFSGELMFNEAFDLIEPYYNELFYIRHKEIIDKFIDSKDIYNSIVGG